MALALEQAARPDSRATAVLARLFATPGPSVYISLSCPDDAMPAAARADVVRFLPLIPPSS